MNQVPSSNIKDARNKHKVRLLLSFAHGCMVGSIFWMYCDFRNENKIFLGLRDDIRSGLPSKEGLNPVFTRATALTHELMQERASIFAGNAEFGAGLELLRSPLIDLNTGIGACGSYPYTLARILQTFDCRVRIGQMLVNGKYGGHMFVEAFNGHKWVVLDPSYGIFFTARDHEMASIEDLQKDWSYFKDQLPVDYKPEYCYQGVRYTNWDKIPIILPAAHTLLSKIFGQKNVDHFCARTIFIRGNKFLLLFLLILESILIFLYARQFRSSRPQAIRLSLR